MHLYRKHYLKLGFTLLKLVALVLALPQKDSILLKENDSRVLSCQYNF